MKRSYKHHGFSISRAVIISIIAVVLCAAAFGIVRYVDNDNSNQSEPTNAVVDGAYTLHKNITATVFWVGEGADEDNDFIQNRSSAWMEDWQGAYGGVDAPDDRCGYNPCGFTPKENPFYFALPFNDYNEQGNAKPVTTLRKIRWYAGQPKPGTSIVKNRWVQITRDGKTAYAQWEDVGPFGEDDVDYVFGTNKPSEPRAGIDLSPAAASYLGVDGRAKVAWRFVDIQQVPDGPWKTIVTTSGLDY